VNKYRAIKTRIDGHLFDSRREAAVYMDLKLLERAGKINALQVHPAVDLHATDNKGIKRKIGRAEFDFSYWCCERKERVWIDVKGMDNAMSRWKRKHTEAEHGIQIEVRR
jgi:hypothetical protein